MKRFAIWCSILATGVAAGQAIGRPPLIDPPTPPPCAADGTCYPNTGGFGYYQGHWRTWPGVQLEPTPSKEPTPAEGGRISPELGPSETPPAELEGEAPPPSSPKRKTPPAATTESPEAPTESGEKPMVEPPAARPLPNGAMPNVPLPDAENRAPLGATGDPDPPPSLPRSIAGGQAAPSEGASRAAAASPLPSRVSTTDPPPSPPWSQNAAL
jgi:hypothetical protein